MKVWHLALAMLLATVSCGRDTSQTTETSRARNAPPAMSHGRAANNAPGGAVRAHQPPEFDTESAATAHCRGDDVVWLNTTSGVYHTKGMRYYGNTKNGAYACRREAEAAGDRESKAG